MDIVLKLGDIELGVPKQEQPEFDNLYTPQMLEYCVQDVN